MNTAAPEFTHHKPVDWINSAPLSLAGLRGEVVLIEFWTFDCINCQRTLPWLKDIQAEYGPRGLRIVSVHTPELPQERDANNVRAAVKELGVTWPVMLDNDFSYWRALDNRYWPAFYLLDREGRIAHTTYGELHRGKQRGDDFEAKLRGLLEGAH